MANKITVPEVLKKDLKLVGFLLASGLGGWLLATYVANNEMLTVVFAPAINYILYRLSKEIENEGYRKAFSK